MIALDDPTLCKEHHAESSPEVVTDGLTKRRRRRRSRKSKQHCKSSTEEHIENSRVSCEENKKARRKKELEDQKKRKLELEAIRSEVLKRCKVVEKIEIKNPQPYLPKEIIPQNIKKEIEQQRREAERRKRDFERRMRIEEAKALKLEKKNKRAEKRKQVNCSLDETPEDMDSSDISSYSSQSILGTSTTSSSGFNSSGLSNTDSKAPQEKQNMLNKHLREYHELMKVQPKRHTTQQLEAERKVLQEAALNRQQDELLKLRNMSESGLTQDSDQQRRAFLEKLREKEKQRNMEEDEDYDCKIKRTKNSSNESTSVAASGVKPKKGSRGRGGLQTRTRPTPSHPNSANQGWPFVKKPFTVEDFCTPNTYGDQDSSLSSIWDIPSFTKSSSQPPPDQGLQRKQNINPLLTQSKGKTKDTQLLAPSSTFSFSKPNPTSNSYSTLPSLLEKPIQISPSHPLTNCQEIQVDNTGSQVKLSEFVQCSDTPQAKVLLYSECVRSGKPEESKDDEKMCGTSRSTTPEHWESRVEDDALMEELDKLHLEEPSEDDPQSLGSHKGLKAGQVDDLKNKGLKTFSDTHSETFQSKPCTSNSTRLSPICKNDEKESNRLSGREGSENLSGAQEASGKMSSKGDCQGNNRAGPGHQGITLTKPDLNTEMDTNASPSGPGPAASESGNANKDGLFQGGINSFPGFSYPSGVFPTAHIQQMALSLQQQQQQFFMLCNLHAQMMMASATTAQMNQAQAGANSGFAQASVNPQTSAKPADQTNKAPVNSQTSAKPVDQTNSLGYATGSGILSSEAADFKSGPEKELSDVEVHRILNKFSSLSSNKRRSKDVLTRKSSRTGLNATGAYSINQTISQNQNKEVCLEEENWDEGIDLDSQMLSLSLHSKKSETRRQPGFNQLPPKGTSQEDTTRVNSMSKNIPNLYQFSAGKSEIELPEERLNKILRRVPNLTSDRSLNTISTLSKKNFSSESSMPLRKPTTFMRCSQSKFSMEQPVTQNNRSDNKDGLMVIQTDTGSKRKTLKLSDVSSTKHPAKTVKKDSPAALFRNALGQIKSQVGSNENYVTHDYNEDFPVHSFKAVDQKQVAAVRETQKMTDKILGAEANTSRTSFPPKPASKKPFLDLTSSKNVEIPHFSEHCAPYLPDPRMQIGTSNEMCNPSELGYKELNSASARSVSSKTSNGLSASSLAAFTVSKLKNPSSHASEHCAPYLPDPRMQIGTSNEMCNPSELGYKELNSASACSVSSKTSKGLSASSLAAFTVSKLKNPLSHASEHCAPYLPDPKMQIGTSNEMCNPSELGYKELNSTSARSVSSKTSKGLSASSLAAFTVSKLKNPSSSFANFTFPRTQISNHCPTQVSDQHQMKEMPNRLFQFGRDRMTSSVHQLSLPAKPSISISKSMLKGKRDTFDV